MFVSSDRFEDGLLFLAKFASVMRGLKPEPPDFVVGFVEEDIGVLTGLILLLFIEKGRDTPGLLVLLTALAYLFVYLGLSLHGSPVLN